MRGVFAPSGAPLAEGDALRQPVLAGTLRPLADDPDDFYRGGIAKSLVETLRARGGTHTVDDFAGYAPEVGPSLTRTSAPRTWHVAPPPSVGAVLIGVVAAASDGTADAVRPASRDAVIRGVTRARRRSAIPERARSISMFSSTSASTRRRPSTSRVRSVTPPR